MPEMWTCAWEGCGRAFEPRRGGTPQLYCSHKCSWTVKNNRRSQKKKDTFDSRLLERQKELGSNKCKRSNCTCIVQITNLKCMTKKYCSDECRKIDFAENQAKRLLEDTDYAQRKREDARKKYRILVSTAYGRSKHTEKSRRSQKTPKWKEYSKEYSKKRREYMCRVDPSYRARLASAQNINFAKRSAAIAEAQLKLTIVSLPHIVESCTDESGNR